MGAERDERHRREKGEVDGDGSRTYESSRRCGVMLEHPQSSEDDEADQPSCERLPIVDQYLDDVGAGGWVLGDLEL